MNELTVKDLFESMAKSSGFIVFVSYISPTPENPNNIEHRYIRQQFIPEDLEKCFESFGKMVEEDLVKSGGNLVKSAERIANKDFPATELPQ